MRASQEIRDNTTIYAMSHNRFNRLMESKGITDDNVEEYKIAFVQIHGPEDAKTIGFHFKREHPNVITLEFHDVTEPTNYPLIGMETYIQYFPMSEEQAEKLYKFIVANEDKAQFIAHCHAGISRSGAVTQFIAEYLDMPLTRFQLMNPWVKPNSQVLRLLRMAFIEDVKRGMMEGEDS